MSIELVRATIARYLTEHGRPVPEIRPSARIMADIGLDSLALAVIVIELEEQTGKDPFANGFREFSTVEELAALYA